MKSILKAYAENFLFALNIFIVFLLLFESRISIPFWLQPLGRMHPLLLHFPIVILLLAMALECFRFRQPYRQQPFYQSFTAYLWLTGLLFSALTVLMGLFLSQEAGYEGAALQWHKWLGIALLLGSSGLYAFRKAAWYTQTTARAAAGLTTFLLIFAGHYGAVLTHGQDFILAPIAGQASAVPLEEALVFDHVVQPILDKKCVSCHNPDKAKGRLLLTDAAAMMKGGKTGELWVAGQPDRSLLLQRLLLPENDKKHMPPVNKAQLSDEEIQVLHLWVKGGANFDQKVVELPARDSLRTLAATFLKPAPAEEAYDFAAPEAQTVQMLNTNYRVVAPLAQSSPALAVNFYGRQAYKPRSLEELREVSQQIVALDLNKMPVQDADLKTVAGFENLRRLNLNFTGVTGKGLQQLTALKHLKTLSLSGTAIRYRDLQSQLPAFKSLHTLTVWQTPIGQAEITKLRQAFPHLNIQAGFSDADSAPIKLNPPQLKNPSPIFPRTLALKLHHPIKGTVIRYTTDGSEPDSLSSPVFKPGMSLAATTLLKTKAYKDGWLGSDVAVFNFYKGAYKPDSLRLSYPLNRVHQANGPRTFFDGELGSFNANSPAWANNWGGVFKNPLELVAQFKQPITLSSVALNTLIESENNIFPPETLEVWGGTSPDKLELLSSLCLSQPEKAEKPLIKLIEASFKPRQVSYLKIIAKPLPALPDWHRGKGRPALLLVDEMFLN
ncbi:MAG: c-type cytochrome domain-containing protein [Adhaeribacter sp.]